MEPNFRAAEGGGQGGEDLAWVSPSEGINHGALAAVKGLGATALGPDSPS